MEVIYYFSDILDVTYISFRSTFIVHAALVLIKNISENSFFFPQESFTFFFETVKLMYF